MHRQFKIEYILQLFRIKAPELFTKSLLLLLFVIWLQKSCIQLFIQHNVL